MSEVTSQELHEKLAKFYRFFPGHDAPADAWTDSQWRQIEVLEALEDEAANG